MAISQDEGATWQRVPLPTTTVSDGLFTANLSVDAQGNLYFAFFGEGVLPHLAISRDGGQSWSVPIQVGAPGVDATRQQLAIAVREPGHVAIAYLGSTDAGNTFSGYITESRNALADSPVFWSAAVNDPSEPLELGTPPADPTDATRQFTNRVLYRTAAIGPDGTPWAGFHCYRTDSCPLGPNDRIGVVGHLEWPDLDGDGVADAADNCPFVANADQLDSGGINTTASDGIGDACQCGDVSGNGIVNGQDANAIKCHALGVEPNPLFAVPGNCDVTGNDACNGQDANAVKRAALGAEANPLFGQNCHNAIGAAVPPDL